MATLAEPLHLTYIQGKTWGHIQDVFPSQSFPLQQLWAPLCREFVWGRNFKLTLLTLVIQGKNKHGYFSHTRLHVIHLSVTSKSDKSSGHLSWYRLPWWLRW